MSSTSGESSTVSFETRIRSRQQYKVSPTRNKSTNNPNLNHRRLTILLLFISFSFLAFTLPAVVINLIMLMKSETSLSSFNNYNVFSIIMVHDIKEPNLLHTLARLSMITNHSINFVLYFLVGRRFRRDLSQLLFGYWRRLYQLRQDNQ